MSSSSKVSRNTVLLSLSTTAALSIGLVINIFLARTLGVERFGEFSFAISFITLSAVLVEFALDPVIVRDVARDPTTAGVYFGNALVLKGVLFLLTVALIVVMGNILGYPSQVRLLLYILSLGLLFDGVRNCCTSLLSAAQLMQYPAALFVAERALFALLGFIAISLQGSVITIALCYVAARAVTQLASVVLVRWKLDLKPERVGYGFCKGLAQRASSFFAISIIAAVYADIDKLFLFSMQDEVAVGLYAATYRLISIPTRFANAFHQALYPVLSKHAASSGGLLPETYRRSMRYLMFGAMPLAVGTTVLAEPILYTVYGQAYVGGAVALQILIWAHALEFFNPFLASVLYAIERQRAVLMAAIGGAGLNVVLNVILIPRYTFVGAAIATVLSASLIFVLLFFWVNQMMPNVSLRAVALKPVFASLIMGTVCVLSEGISLIPRVVLGAIVYFGCLLLTKAFSPEELLIFHGMLRGRVWPKRVAR